MSTHRSRGKRFRTATAVLASAALVLSVAPPAAAAPTTPDNLSVAVSLVSDGTAPFSADDTAGNDSGATNGIVRVNDTVSFRVSYRVRGDAADDVTFSVTLPRGMALSEVPAYCRSGSLTPATVTVPVPVTATTVDSLPQQTLRCNVGTQAASTYEAPLTPKVLNPVRHGQPLQVVAATIEADGVTTPVPTTEPLPSVTASSRLQWDLSKNGISTVEDQGAIGNPAFALCRWDTSRTCLRTTYHVMLSGPAGGKGAMPATGDVTLVDDLSPAAMYPQLAAAQIAAIEADLDRYGSRVYEGERTHLAPGSKIGKTVGGVLLTPVNSVRDSGTVIIDQPGAGRPATITLRDADLSLTTYPTQVASPVGTALPATSAYAVSVALDVYTPVDTIREFGSRPAPGAPWRLPTMNRYTQFRAQGLTAADVVTSADQPAWNDYKSTTPEVSIGQGFDKSFAGVPGAAGNTAPGAYQPGDPWRAEGPPGGALRRSGQVTVAPGQEVVSLLNVKGSNPALPAKVSQVMCDAWDSSVLHLKAKDWPASSTAGGQMVPSDGKAVWVSGYTNVVNAAGTNATNATSQSQTPPLTVQYSPTPGGKGALSSCGDANGPWYDSPEAVPGNDPAKAAQGVYTAVARVRVHMVVPEPVGPFPLLASGITTQVAIGYEVADAGRPAGTVIPNWASIKREDFKELSMPELLASPASTWTTSYYDPATSSGGTGDRLLLSEAQARVHKSVRKGTTGDFGTTPPSTTGNDLVQYQLAVSLTSSTTASLRRDLWVEDCLPESQTYVSAVPAPAVVSETTPSDARRAACAAGHTYLRWQYDDHPVNTPIDPIVVTAEVSPMAADGTYDNTVVVWGENDASPVALRSSSAQVQVTNIAGLALQKIALTPVVQVNRPGQATDQLNRWRVRAKNTLPGTDPRVVEDPTVIDVLPRNGLNGSSFSGTAVLVEAVRPAGDTTLTFHYTSSPTVEIDPQHPSNGAAGSTAWCSAPAGGTLVSGTGACPASADEVTAVRAVKPGTFASGATFEFDVAVKGVGDAAGDTFVNAAALAARGFTYSVGPLYRAETVVASSIGDRFWKDSDGDGIQDPGEPGVDGATVTLTGTDDLGNPVSATTTTGADGSYRFSGLRASDATGYTVTFSIPPTWHRYEFAPDRVGGDRSVDSDADPGGIAPPVVLGAGVDDLTVDAGIGQPSIALTKTADIAAARPGDTITYTFTATNDGSTSLHALDLVDVRFTNAHGQPISLGPITFHPDRSTGTLNRLDVGQTLVWTASYTVAAGDLTVDGSLENRAEVFGISPFGNLVMDIGEAWVRSAATATYVLGKTAVPATSSTVQAGDRVTYTVTVGHRGDVPVTGASFTDDLLEVLDDATWDGTVTASTGTARFSLGSRTVSWTGDLAVGATATITYSVTVRSGGDLTLRNGVATTDTRGRCDTDCVTTHTVLAAPAIGLVKTADRAEARVGDVITYTFTATNTGNLPLTDVTLAETSFVNGRGQPVTLDRPPRLDAGASTGTVTRLEVGQVLVWRATYTVSAADLDEGKDIANTATVTATAPSGDRVTDDDTTSVRSAGRGTFTYEKKADPASGATVAEGATVTYTLTITHTGELRTLGADVTDDLSAVVDDAGFDGILAASSGVATYARGTLAWEGDLEVGQVVTVTYTVTVGKGGDLSLRNVLTSTDARGACASATGCETVHTVAAAPAVDLVKTADRAEARVGDVITYTFTATNTGNQPLTDVTLDERAFTNARGQAITLDAPPVVDPAASTGTVADLGIGQVLVWRATRTVTASDLDEGRSITNTARVSGRAPGGGTVSDEADAAVASSGRGTFVVAKSAAGATGATVAVGDTIAYTVTIAQAGELRVVGATVTDDLSAVLDDAVYAADVRASSGTATVTGTTLTWTGDVEVGETVTVTYSVRVRGGGDLTLRNTVTTTDARGSCPTTCETTHAIPAAPGIELVKTADTASVRAGDVITYTFTATSTGNVTLRDVRLTETSFVNARGRTISLDAPPVVDPAASTGTVAALAPGQSVVWRARYTVTATDLDEGRSITNAARVEATAPSGAQVDDTADESVVSQGTGTYVLTKTATPAGPVQVGDTVTYAVTVRQTGELRVVGATFTDDLARVLDDATLDAAAVTATGGTATVEGRTIAWRGDLEVGQSVTVTYPVTVTRGGDLSLVNAVTTNDARGGCSAPGACETVTTIPPGPSIGLVKTADKASVKAGDVITYTFTATNTGNVALRDVALAETSFVNARGERVTLDAPPQLLPAATTGTPERLLPDQVLVWTARYTVRATDLDEGRAITNTAAVSALAADGTSVAASDDVSSASSGRGAFTVAKTAGPAPGATVRPGDRVTYTVTLTHAEQLRVAGATVTDDLSGVLDDARWNGDLTASSGTATVAGTTLRWTGDVEVGQTVTITYSVTVRTGGDRTLTNTVTTADAHGGCGTCVTRHPVAATGGGLPGTGGPSAGVVALAMAALVGGAALVAGARRR